MDALWLKPYAMTEGTALFVASAWMSASKQLLSFLSNFLGHFVYVVAPWYRQLKELELSNSIVLKVVTVIQNVKFNPIPKLSASRRFEHLQGSLLRNHPSYTHTVCPRGENSLGWFCFVYFVFSSFNVNGGQRVYEVVGTTRKN